MLRIQRMRSRFQSTRPEQQLVVVTLRGEPKRFLAASYARPRGLENPVLLTFASWELAKRVSADVAQDELHRHDLVTVCARDAARRAFDELHMDMVVVHGFDKEQQSWEISYLSKGNCWWLQDSSQSR